MDLPVYNHSQSTNLSRPHPDGKPMRRLLYGEVPRVVIPEGELGAPEPSRILQSLRILVQHGISPGQLLCLFCGPAQEAYLQICTELQNNYGWQSLCNSIQALNLCNAGKLHDPVSETQTPSSGPPGSFQQGHDPRWSTLSGDTLRDSRVICGSFSKALDVQSTPKEDLCHQPSQIYAPPTLDSPFAAAVSPTFSDALEFDFQFTLPSDKPVIESVEDNTGFNAQHRTIHSSGFTAGVGELSSLPQQRSPRPILQHFHSTATTPSQTATPGSSTVRHQRSSTGISAHPPTVPDKEFIGYAPPVPPKPCYRSPCPYCTKDFKSQKEFISHMTAEHDRPTRYVCLHPVQGRNSCCNFETYRLSRFNKHHTEEHGKHCNLAQEDNRQRPSCRGEYPAQCSKQVWGCWMCDQPTYSVREYVKHHMEQHKSCTRQQMKWTWLMQSLLSQDATRLLWHNQIHLLEATTEYRWRIEWSEAAKEPVRDRLIYSLQTASFEGRSFDCNPSACQSVVMAAMDATFDFKSMLEPVVADSRSSKRPSTSSPPRCDSTTSSRSRPLRRQKSFAGPKYYPTNVSTVATRSTGHPTADSELPSKEDLRQRSHASQSSG